MKVKFLTVDQPADQSDGRENCPEVDIPASASLYDAALMADAPLFTTCGGKGTCGKCRVLPRGQLNAPTSVERRYLKPADLTAGYRLACQSIPISDVTVEIPAASRALVILTQDTHHNFTLRPNVARVELHVPRPAGGRCEVETTLDLLKAAGHTECHFSLHAIQKLPACLRKGRGHILLTLIGRQVVEVDITAQVEPIGLHDTKAKEFGIRVPRTTYGMAFDIGTTTVVGYLLDLNAGQQVAVVSTPNPQAALGADVVTRLSLAFSDPQGLNRLCHAIRQTLNKLVVQAARSVNVSIESIYEITVVGNTAMHHLFLGINPASLLVAPYLPAVIKPLELLAKDVGLRIAPAGRVYVLPNIASYVGADTVGVILATGLDRCTKLKLAIDIGTNGEIVLGNRDRLVACSTAAGPAFEGARISCGMVAAIGAIDQVQFFRGDLRLHTIGGVPPRGICGSGLVDLVAILLRHGILQSDGCFVPHGKLPVVMSPALAGRLIQDERGKELNLHQNNSGQISLTQRDVRELQLAKGAIRAGIEILLEELGVTSGDVTEVYLAGAFGNYVQPESAQDIGLLPHFPQARITPVGNAAGTGAQMALLSVADRRRAAGLVGQIDYVDLASCPAFQDRFAAAMRFPRFGQQQ